MSDFFCVDVIEVDLVKSYGNDMTADFELPRYIPTVKVVPQRVNQNGDMPSNLRESNSSATLDENANSIGVKTKRSVRFTDDNEVLEYEPWEPIEGREDREGTGTEPVGNVSSDVTPGNLVVELDGQDIVIEKINTDHHHDDNGEVEVAAFSMDESLVQDKILQSQGGEKQVL